MKERTLGRSLVTGLLFGFLVILAVSLIGDLRQVREEVFSFRWAYFPLVLILTLFNYTLRLGKFHFYLRQVGVADCPLLESARIFVAGFPLAVTPGKIGEVLKGIWLERKTGLPVARGVAVVVAERISDGLAVLVLSSLGVIAFPRYWPAFAIVLGILLSLIFLSQIPSLAHFFLSAAERLPLVRNFASSLHEFYDGSTVLFRPFPTLVAVSLGAVSWLGEGVGFYLILLGLGLPAGWKVASIAVFVLAFSTVVGGISTLPGGLGAVEVSIAGMLVLLLGLEASIAAAATLLIRFATLWFGVSLGLMVWAFSPDLVRSNSK